MYGLLLSGGSGGLVGVRGGVLRWKYFMSSERNEPEFDGDGSTPAEQGLLSFDAMRPKSGRLDVMEDLQSYSVGLNFSVLQLPLIYAVER